MSKNYRAGAIGALLDIYEQAISELILLIGNIKDHELPLIQDPITTDENCRSFQSILTHVVHSGYGYATSINNLKGARLIRPEKNTLQTIEAYQQELHNVFVYTEKIFRQFNDNELEESDEGLKIKLGSIQLFDVEQMTEHAIVHILRHKRQIEKMLELKSK